MPRVTYISQDEKATTLDIAVGTSVMQAAIFNGVDGIVAECGGACMCAACHVFLSQDMLALTSPMEADQDAVLESTASARKPHHPPPLPPIPTPPADRRVLPP